MYIIFVFPLFLLGTVTPSLVKYTVDNLDDNGKLVGNLNAANTIGSIIGTFVPTFISIPAVGPSITFLIFAGILLILSAVYFITSKISLKKIKRLPASIVIFALCCTFGWKSNFAFWQNNLLYEGESIYNYLQVYDDDRAIYFSTNVLFSIQSVYLKEKGLTSGKIIHVLNTFYELSTAQNGVPPMAVEVFEERKEVVKRICRQEGGV